MPSTVIVSASRTPIGKFGGVFRTVPAVELGAVSLKETLSRAEWAPEKVDHVIMGMVLQGGAGQIPSRQAARKAGLPWEVESETINKVCASGLRAVTLADQMIRAGDAEVILAGGMESMSQAPYILPKARWGYRMGDQAAVDLMVHDGLTCPFDHVHMAVHGSNVAAEYGIDRQAQDEWALRSHRRAVEATEKGWFREEIVPVTVQERKKEQRVVDTDEAPRKDTSLEALAKLPPVFTSDGTITAGNAPGVNDGASSLLLMSLARAKQEGRRPLATILGHAAVADQAPYIARTPALAIQKLLAKTGYRLEQIDLLEVNEAFAAVVLTSGKILGWDEDKVNVHGGAIALGHPIGASGARILTTLIYALRRRGGGLGIAAICSGAAQGDAILIKVDEEF
ncbi:acetyl-CoA acetyltransferase [Caldalkalibacillus thermarum TA2.A1]|uniref:acetyl-CoA C-acetyltransferase n=1 Tax=Caldalkalibacillus thermarum (strain TA2.A1) TaxID=986075 RepID=F5L6Z4_CALTT|nr:acetyl-CoA C-acetyltransferase [Caldalkalibacillus thermarum]EGL82882.1 acetyl-CoA acetyltransferase [Caldalkalibacillus thermarum TA2.A1]QZT34201.1 acetyl-CoA C-acetyltransferase [Caldalkalibacillus thermarum TA2.A1]